MLISVVSQVEIDFDSIVFFRVLDDNTIHFFADDSFHIVAPDSAEFFLYTYRNFDVKFVSVSGGRFFNPHFISLTPSFPSSSHWLRVVVDASTRGSGFRELYFDGVAAELLKAQCESGLNFPHPVI